MNASMPPPLTEHSASDSSSIISSPPQSPPHNNALSADEIAVARPGGRPNSTFGEGVVGGSSAAAPQAPTLLSTPHAPESIPQPSTAPVKVKKPRKPREPKEVKVAPDGQPVKEKKPRKPREPKVKTEGTPNAAPRKKAKAADKMAPSTAPDVTAGPRQSTLIGQFYQPGQPASAPQPQQPLPSTLGTSPRPQPPSNSDNMSHNTITPQLSAQPSAPLSRPISSGQNYDPIRGATYSPAPPRPTAAVANGAHSAHASPQINRASASPSIGSLIDPPQAMRTSTPTVSYVQQANLHPVPQQTAAFVNSTTTSPRSAAVAPIVPSLPPSPLPMQQQASSMDGAMDVDEAPKQPTLKQQPPSKSSSSAATPKASKPVSPPAKPASKAGAGAGTGSGLLSSNSLFGGPSSETDSEPKGLTIDFRIKLDPAGGNQINIAKEIIKKYGSDAIDPHAAAHRSRLRAVAMVQNKLEANSTDDMSVDLGSEVDGDSNVEMGGMDDERSGAGGEPVRKRRKKVEEYDKEDDFIDDRELAWEENAAVAKDGFFVYSGPLVAEGEAAKVEASAPTRGRGGGRGRGRGRGGAAAGAGGAAATTTAARKDTNAPAAPARGRGSRGGRVAASGTVRKRPTKAEKDKADAEKAQREQFPIQQQSLPPSAAPTASASGKSPWMEMGPSTTMPAPVQPQHVLHSNYGGSATSNDMQQHARVQA